MYRSHTSIALALIAVLLLGVGAAQAAKPPETGLEKISIGLLQKLEHGKGKPGGDVHRVIVSLQPALDERTGANPFSSPALEAQRHMNVRAVQARVLNAARKGIVQPIHMYNSLYGFSAYADEQGILKLAALKDVVAIEEMPVLYKMDAESLPLTNTDDAHAAGFTGQGVTIAVIDDGIDHDHATFGGETAWPNSKILGGYDFADNDSDPRIDCTSQSHGTAVTGVATGNGGGVTGTAPDAKVVFLKIQSSSICGQNGLDGDIIGAIDWAVTNRATYDIKIISMSLGGSTIYSGPCDSSNTAYRDSINAAVSAGMTVLVASGNSASSSGITAPACIDNALAVGATYDANIGSANFGSLCSDSTTAADKITCYSNSGSELDVLAPSHCALTANAGGGQDTCFGGTSSATPFAAGVVADMLEKDATLTPASVKSLLQSNGVSITDSRNNITRSRVDTMATLDAIGGGGGGGGSELQNGVPVTGLSGSTGSETHYTVAIPAGATNLSISISGGTGDADLYVKFGSQPTTSSYDCRPYKYGNNETCDFASPSAGTYYVMLRGYSAYSGVTLEATWDEPGGGCTPGGGSVGPLSGSAGSEDRYYLDVPACATSLTVEISGGTGDADLYVKFGSQPTTSSYDCRPYKWGNNETCTFDNPSEGRWHIMVRGYSSYSGVTLDANYQ